MGLSPRVRGNRVQHPGSAGASRSIPACAGEPHLHRPNRQPRIRSIPACAGEPPANRPARPAVEVYPRVCGGTIACPSLCAIASRSIPACAGEPPIPVPVPELTEVYPRVCGGTTSGIRRLGCRWGLSPRVRGNRSSGRRLVRFRKGLSPRVRGNLRGDSVAGLRRSIPACAGEPTGRDEQQTGLSPRVRGNLLLAARGERR